MAISPQAIAKHLAALQKKLGSEQIQWGIGGTAIIDLGAASMRQEHDGAIACAGGRIHFFRKSMMGGTHESLPLSAVESTEVATVRFADGEVDVVLLNRNDNREPWGISTDADQRQFFLDKLAQS